MENCLPFTDDVMVVLVHKCVQQTHLLALHLETLGYIPRLLNALNGLVYFLIIGDPRGDNLMVGSISRKLLTELGIRTEDAECKLMGDKCNFVIFVLIIKRHINLCLVLVQEDPSRHNRKIVDWDVKNQTKQTKQPGTCGNHDIPNSV